MTDEATPERLAVLSGLLSEVGARFARMLRHVPDPEAPAVGEWTVGETGAHVANGSGFFLEVARGDAEPEELGEVAAHNAAVLAADPERNPRVLADRIEAGERELAEYLGAVEGDPPVEVFRGVTVPLSTLAAVEVAELLVHGWDIARAARLPWWTARDEAAPVVNALMPLLPHLVDAGRAAGLSARFELRVRGGGRGILAFDGGSARLEDAAAGPVDCRLSVDPGAYLLVAFRRVGVLRPLLGGKLAAWGRRPWLGTRFPSLFVGV